MIELTCTGERIEQTAGSALAKAGKKKSPPTRAKTAVSRTSRLSI
jgi:hypothetical protein